MIKALLIDLDGTLAESLEFLYKAYETVLKQRGLKPSRKEFNVLNGPSIREIASLLEKKYGLTEPIYNEWRAILLPYYRDEIRLAEGAQELVEFAKGRWKLALVSSAERELATLFLKRHHLQFDLVVCREDVVCTKPDPEPYRLALHQLNINAEEAIAIEDSENGVLAAKQAGIKTFVINKDNFFTIIAYLEKLYG